jgi:hypothetical protein
MEKFYKIDNFLHHGFQVYYLKTEDTKLIKATEFNDKFIYYYQSFNPNEEYKLLGKFYGKNKINLSENLCDDKKLFSEELCSKENTMNLSENLCDDKKLFSEELCSKENTMNLSENLCDDKKLFSEELCSKENTMNLSENLCDDKKLFSEELCSKENTVYNNYDYDVYNFENGDPIYSDKIEFIYCTILDLTLPKENGKNLLLIPNLTYFNYPVYVYCVK